MESKLRSLPPLKRLRLLHQEKQQSESILLPAKKRKQSRQSSKSTEFSPPTPTTTTFCLPAKKRVWAIRPDFSPTKSPPTSTRTCFDLNLEYTPSPQKDPNSVTLHNPPNENTDFGKHKESLSKDGMLGVEQANPDEEDDGILCAVRESSDGDASNVKTDLEGPTESLSKDRILGSEQANPDEDGTAQHQAEEDDGIVHAVCENPDGDPQNENTDEILGSEQANPDEEEDDDGILCAVCESTDGDPSDPIVFCDGCDLMVHASCYGNPLVNCIPEGDWFCAQCSLSKSSIRCCLCPAKGGAMKPTTDGKWAHIICALLVPEVFFEDPDGREGINCDKIPKKRWREICYVCKRRKRGCVVDCSEQKCGLSFHVSCGLKEELCIELKEGKYSGGVVAAFCKDHTQLWKKQQQTGKFRIVARED